MLNSWMQTSRQWHDLQYYVWEIRKQQTHTCLEAGVIGLAAEKPSVLRPPASGFGVAPLSEHLGSKPSLAIVPGETMTGMIEARVGGPTAILLTTEGWVFDGWRGVDSQPGSLLMTGWLVRSSLTFWITAAMFSE